MKGEYRFVSNLHATDDGLNDAGIETFSADADVSNIRECIQNSLDQISDEARKSGRAVIVEFDDFEITPKKYPNIEQFREILECCIKTSVIDQNVQSFFEKAKKITEENIKVLRISDFNTTGLVGAETAKRGEPWYNLIKSKGSSNKNMSSGGSFGIGKSAPFACSALRTVFYGSKVNEIDSYIGVSRLISFESESGRTIGTGYYSDSEELRAIMGNVDLNDYRRTENGTDLFIMGYDGNDSLEKVIIESALKNFFISIYKGLLVVKYKNIELNKDTIGQYISKLDDKNFAELKVYYQLLTTNPAIYNTDIKKICLNAQEFGAQYGINDGECTLYLMRGENLNRRILMTRKTGMWLFQQDRINASISFTGILHITGDKMNELFKSMEMPAHDAWEPKRCRMNTKTYINAYDDLKRYIRDKVNENFGVTESEMISAYGMEEFFSNFEAGKNDVKISVLGGSPKVKLKKAASPNKSKRRRKPIKVNGSTEENLYGLNEKSVKKSSNTDDNNETNVEDKKAEGNKKKPKDNFEFFDVKKRLICRSEKKGEYELNFKIPKTRKSIKLEFLGIAEKGNYPLMLVESSVINESIGDVVQKDNIMMINNVIKDSNISVRFKIAFDKRCMMGVNYYEDK